MPGSRLSIMRGIEMLQMQMHVVLVGPEAAAFPDLDGDGAGDDVARSKILGGRRVALHEFLAFGIAQKAAFAARAFGDQDAGAIDAGRVELHEFHVLERQPGAEHHGVAVAGADMGGGAGEIGAAIAAGGEDGLVRPESVDGAVLHRKRDHAAAAAFVVHDQVDGEKLDEEFGGLAQRLAVHGVQHGVAGAVGGGAGALGLALAVIRWSCRRRRAAGSCRRRCARTARPNARARKRLRARCGRDIRWRPGRRASPSP